MDVGTEEPGEGFEVNDPERVRVGIGDDGVHSTAFLAVAGDLAGDF